MSTATGTALRLRVMVTDAWDTVHLEVQSDTTVTDLKIEALTRTLGRTVDPSVYEVKFRGGVVLDETATLADLGVPDHAALIVLSARRRPVR